MSAVPKPVRVRDPDYLAYIRTQPCLLAIEDPCTCGGYLDVVRKTYRIEAAHVRIRGAGGGDDQVMPLCGTHHREAHRIGHKSFAKRHRVNLALEARAYRQGYLAKVRFLETMQDMEAVRFAHPDPAVNARVLIDNIASEP